MSNIDSQSQRDNRYELSRSPGNRYTSRSTQLPSYNSYINNGQKNKNSYLNYPSNANQNYQNSPRKTQNS
jgi:hypothetical protein